MRPTTSLLLAGVLMTGCRATPEASHDAMVFRMKQSGPADTDALDRLTENTFATGGFDQEPRIEKAPTAEPDAAPPEPADPRAATDRAIAEVDAAAEAALAAASDAPL